MLRVHQASRSAQAIAEHCLGHPEVAQVLYPGLGNDPGHTIAKRQMSGGFGGMLSIRVQGGREAALAVVGRLELFARATSLGGVESLVEHRATIEGPDSPVPADLLRLSVGIEEVGDLLYIVSILAIALGVGFVLSALVSYVLSQRLGLLEPPGARSSHA